MCVLGKSRNIEQNSKAQNKVAKQILMTNIVGKILTLASCCTRRRCQWW